MNISLKSNRENPRKWRGYTREDDPDNEKEEEDSDDDKDNNNKDGNAPDDTNDGLDIAVDGN